MKYVLIVIIALAMAIYLFDGGKKYGETKCKQEMQATVIEKKVEQQKIDVRSNRTRDDIIELMRNGKR